MVWARYDEVLAKEIYGTERRLLLQRKIAISIASMIRLGIMIEVEIGREEGIAKKVTPSTSVKTATPFSEDTAQGLRQEQFAIRKINSANRQA